MITNWLQESLKSVCKKSGVFKNQIETQVDFEYTKDRINSGMVNAIP